MAISLKDLDLKKKCESPAEMELLGSEGQSTGVRLMVLGGQAEAVTRHINKAINEARRNAALAVRRDRRGHVSTIEEDIEFGVESVAVRIVGWSGITEEYTPDNAVTLCASNTDICRQVREFSEDLANFTKG